MSDHLLSILETQIQNHEQLLREREQDLEQLRRDRDRLTEMNHKREELEAQLRGIETDIGHLERSMSNTLMRLGTRMDNAQSPARSAAGSPPATLPVAPPTPATASNGTVSHPREPLADVIRRTLRAAKQPITGPKLAQKILADGYVTTSKSFPRMVKGTLAKMTDVENVPGKGYRLKPKK